MVSEGLEVPSEGIEPHPTAYRLGWSQQRCQWSTTEVPGESPMTWVPPAWPAPR